MLIADGDHHAQNIIPGFRLHHDGIGEHAAIPADMAEALEDGAGFVAEPVAGVAGNIELAGGFGGQAMPAGLVM